ncbi:MAG: hypothetical protein GY834_11165 [Bacteroidetes bacterium]|nr:hypothetical protein [Bacteroidota bacterium]
MDLSEDVLSAESCEDADLNTYDDSGKVENSENADGSDGGAKVLNHRTNEEVMGIVRESTRRQREYFDPDIVKLSEEIGDMSTLKNHRGKMLPDV